MALVVDGVVRTEGERTAGEFHRLRETHDVGALETERALHGVGQCERVRGAEARGDARQHALRDAVLDRGGAERDAQAFVAWLDGRPQVNKAKKVGTQGYCMGGPLVLRTAAAVPARIGAVGSFHGGGLVTQAPDSPHTMIPKMKAQFLIAIAQNDDKQQPDAKDVLKKAFADAKLAAEVEVYPAQHGWCVPDFNQPP
ncbi:hypothetical protein EON77_16240, partial [bacterium]